VTLSGNNDDVACARRRQRSRDRYPPIGLGK